MTDIPEKKYLKILFKRDKSLLSRSAKEILQMVIDNENIKQTKHKFDLLVTDFKLKNNL